jgi:CRISPR-associated protein Csx10
MKLTFKITLLSDYHIGAGHGKGIVDSVLLKDNQSLPVIRGTTLSGLLRQGMWELLQISLLEQHRKCKHSGGVSGISYCSYGEAKSMCPICRTLGTPAYPKKWRISSAEIEEKMILKPEMVAWRNRVNPKTRRTEARKLFNEEMAGKGVNFLFSISNDSNDREILEEAAFIVAAFRIVRNLGSSRRRGKGLCQIHLVNVTDAHVDLETNLEDYFLDVFKTVWVENKKLDITKTVFQSETIKELIPTKKMFNIILLTEEPLLIANKSESGNMYYTSRYIPGYTLLGALAWKAANSCNLDDKEVYEQFIRLFRRGGVKVSPLYTALKIVDDIYPSIPPPRDFLSCKLFPEFEEHGCCVQGYATDTEEPGKCELCLKEGIETPLEPMNKNIAIRKYHKHLEAVEVPVREEMHIAIDPRKGRTVTGVLFGYEAIDSGAYFVGTIEIADWANFVNLLRIDGENPVFELRIGKASARGHGKVKVWLQSDMDSKNLFLGTSLKERVTDLTTPIRMTLITDTILVGKWGQFLNKPDESFLKGLLSVEVEILNTYVKTKMVDGFNAYLGLPKWRDVAIIAGSSIGFKIEYPEDKEALLKHLEELEREGIGLRREEGFGRIAFNHPIYLKNEGVESGIHLPENMRIKREREDTVKSFLDWWEKHLKGNLDHIRFMDPRWIAISRWLRANSRESPGELINTIDNFHKLEEPLSGLINQKKAIRDKKKFLEEKETGKDVLKSVLRELSKELEEKDEKIKEYLQSKAVEKLADFIASNIQERK